MYVGQKQDYRPYCDMTLLFDQRNPQYISEMIEIRFMYRNKMKTCQLEVDRTSSVREGEKRRGE